jgi:hypothetical protein
MATERFCSLVTRISHNRAGSVSNIVNNYLLRSSVDLVADHFSVILASSFTHTGKGQRLLKMLMPQLSPTVIMKRVSYPTSSLTINLSQLDRDSIKVALGLDVQVQASVVRSSIKVRGHPVTTWQHDTGKRACRSVHLIRLKPGEVPAIAKVHMILNLLTRLIDSSYCSDHRCSSSQPSPRLGLTTKWPK